MCWTPGPSHTEGAWPEFPVSRQWPGPSNSLETVPLPAFFLPPTSVPSAYHEYECSLSCLVSLWSLGEGRFSGLHCTAFPPLLIIFSCPPHPRHMLLSRQHSNSRCLVANVNTLRVAWSLCGESPADASSPPGPKCIPGVPVP